MNVTLIVGGSLAMALGLAHSWLGEQFILIRLLRRLDLPKVMGSELFTKRILRFAWHLTTVLMLGLGAIPLLLSGEPLSHQAIMIVRLESATFLLCGAVSLAVTRARHFSWVVFLAISILLWLGAR